MLAVKMKDLKTFLRKSLLKADEMVTENQTSSPELGGHDNEWRDQSISDTNSDTGRIQTTDMEFNRRETSSSATNSETFSDIWTDLDSILFEAFDADSNRSNSSNSDTESDTSSDTDSSAQSDTDST